MKDLKTCVLVGVASMLLLGGSSHAEPLIYAYVSVFGYPPPSNVGVSVINTRSNVVATSIVRPGPGRPDWREIVITPDGTRAYLTHFDSNTVSVIDTETGTIAATVTVGAAPSKMAITPNGAYVYVVGYNSVEVIDTTTNTVVSSIANVTNGATGIAITPDGTRAYVGRQTASVAVIDTATNTVTTNIVGPGGYVSDIAITPDGTRAYFTNYSLSGRVSMIDIATNTITTGVGIPVGSRPTALAITPDGTDIYVANGNSDSVSVIDVVTNTVTSTIAVNNNRTLTQPSDVAITPDGGSAYVVSPNLGSVFVIDTATNTVVTNIVVAPPAVNGISTFSSQAIAITPVAIEIAPTVSGIFAGPNPVAISTGTPLVATVDDSATGGSIVAAAQYRVDGGSYLPMQADDGAFDGATEVVTATTTGFAAAGSHEICVRGVDQAGKTSNPVFDSSNACALISAFDPSTPLGADVDVLLMAANPSGGAPVAVELTFYSVESPGVTTVTATDSPTDGAPETPSDFKLGEPPVYYDVDTTASFSGDVALCFSWQEGQFAYEENIALFHYVGGVWQDVTTSVDLDANKVCGVASSFSPFALFERTYTIDGFFAPIDNQPTLNLLKAGAAVPVKFSLGGNKGLNVMAVGYPSSKAIACNAGAPVDTVTETLAASASGLKYDASTDTYVYVWKTENTWARSCRRLTLKMTDGTSKSADFHF